MTMESKITEKATPCISIAERIRSQDHHQQCELCITRAKYRQGKEFKAVKVYTVNQESRHLILQNIPAVKLGNELKKLCGSFGQVECFELIPNYPAFDEFTETFYLKYKLLKEARFAKKKLDNRSFYGGLIHICYAPELETVQECREKLIQREQYVQRYVDPYSLSLATKGKCKDSQPGSKFNQKSAAQPFFFDSVTGTTNINDQPHTRTIIKKRKGNSIHDQQASSSFQSHSSHTAIAVDSHYDEKPEGSVPSSSQSQLSTQVQKGSKSKHIQDSMWKLQQGDKNEKRNSSTEVSLPSVHQSEKTAIAPQQWVPARTGQQKATFANPKSVQSSITSATARISEKEFCTNTEEDEAAQTSCVKEDFPLATAGPFVPSSLALTTSCSRNSKSVATKDALPVAFPPTVSNCHPSATHRILLTKTHRDNQVKPKPLSQTRIVFHLHKRGKKTETADDDGGCCSGGDANKRKKDDEDGKLVENDGKK